MSDKDEKYVGVTAVMKALGVPRIAVYRMAADGRIPAHKEPRKPWHTKEHITWRFLLSEVLPAYERLKHETTGEH